MTPVNSSVNHGLLYCSLDSQVTDNMMDVLRKDAQLDFNVLSSFNVFYYVPHLFRFVLRCNALKSSVEAGIHT